jgi:hypothetical protein
MSQRLLKVGPLFRKSHSLPFQDRLMEASNANDDLKEESGDGSDSSDTEGGLEARCGAGEC